MQKILFIPYVLESHMLPTLGVAKILRDKYSIVYALPVMFNGFATLHGYQHAELNSYPIALNFDRFHGFEKKRGYLAAMRERILNKSVHKREKDLRELIEKVRPDFILLDLLSGTDFILLY
ncbi:MAG: hypothetical protein ABUT20_31885 [Bacteroidota bacterium]